MKTLEQTAKDVCELVNQGKRLCAAHNPNCELCPLYGLQCQHEDAVKQGPEVFVKWANKVLTWAAEHPEKPEPVYPTWREWWNEFALLWVQSVNLVTPNGEKVHIYIDGNNVKCEIDGAVISCGLDDRIITYLAEALDVAPLDDNPALTVEELMGMDGARVWVESMGASAPSSWYVVDTAARLMRAASGDWYEIGGYCTKAGLIKVYRRKVEEGV